MTDDIVIRPLALDDAEAVQRYASDARVADTTTIPHPYPDDGAISYIRKCLDEAAAGTSHTFAIVVDGQVVGAVEIGVVDRAAGLGQCDYALSPSHWNRGIMTRAVAAALRFAFVDLRLTTVRSACLARNPASGRVLAKNGFTETPKRTFTEGKLAGEEARQFALHRRDWIGVTSDATPLGLRSGTVALSEHRPEWARLFERERGRIRAALGDLASFVVIEHIGSTSVPGLVAKPLLDLAIAVPSEPARTCAIERLVPLGYIDRGDKGDDGGWLLVRETAPRVRAAHLHLVIRDDPQLAQWLAFRDLLRRSPEARRRYADRKRELAAAHELDRQAYTAGKEDLIVELTREALGGG